VWDELGADVAITTEDIRKLREATGAGVMECKRALTEADGDQQRAMKILKDQGALIAQKKSDRVAAQGLVESYVHGGGRIGVLVEVNCETDFVARSDDFKQLARDLAMQIAAMNPRRIGNEDEAAGEADLAPEEVLLTQAFIRDPGQTVTDRVNETVSRVRERIVVRRFARFELGS
jgi:elongation factor Ts